MIEIKLDGEGIHDWQQFHEQLAARLEFPSWYGGNLDALYDCLTDIHEDTVLIIINGNQLREHLGDYGNRLLRVIRQAEQENPRFHVEESAIHDKTCKKMPEKNMKKLKKRVDKSRISLYNSRAGEGKQKK